jgi:hypothetical protein
MSSTRLNLLLHPVRLRLVNTLAAGGTLTTAELCERLPDLAKATLYRQVELLRRGGVFEIESERRVRGAVERRYRLAPRGTLVDPDSARSMTLEDHRRGFTAAMAALMGEFNAYLDRGGAEPTRDEVSYKQFTLWLKPAERSRLIREFSRLLRPRMKRGPGAGRVPYLVSTIFFPASKT